VFGPQSGEESLFCFTIKINNIILTKGKKESKCIQHSYKVKVVIAWWLTLLNFSIDQSIEERDYQNYD